MTKKYIASSQIHISVNFENGSRRHISFLPITGGTSVYYSSDPDEQAALEAHPRFNRLFKATVVEEPVVPSPEPVIPVAAETGLTRIVVTDLEDAKNYLSDKFGLSRTKLRSKAAIEAAALANKIEFEGI